MNSSFYCWNGGERGRMWKTAGPGKPDLWWINRLPENPKFNSRLAAFFIFMCLRW
jgi:hypothetical protein